MVWQWAYKPKKWLRFKIIKLHALHSQNAWWIAASNKTKKLVSLRLLYGLAVSLQIEKWFKVQDCYRLCATLPNCLTKSDKQQNQKKWLTQNNIIVSVQNQKELWTLDLKLYTTKVFKRLASKQQTKHRSRAKNYQSKLENQGSLSKTEIMSTA